MGAALLSTGTVQATPASHGTSSGHVMTMPAAPKAARPGALLAVAPSTSPAVRTAYAGRLGRVLPERLLLRLGLGPDG